MHSTLSLPLHAPTLPSAPAVRRRRRRRGRVAVNKLSDADLEAELAARRAARSKERERYARALRSEKLSALEGELHRLRQELVRAGRGGLHGTPPNARWEPLPERRGVGAGGAGAGGNKMPPGTPVPRGPGAPPPMPPLQGDGDGLFVDPETRRREKEERQRRREEKRKEREANRKPLTLAEIIKSAGPDPMRRLKPPGSIAVPDVHEPEEHAVGGDELKDVREGLKKVESKEGSPEKKDGDDAMEGAEKDDDGKKNGEEEAVEGKGDEDRKAANGEDEPKGKDGEEKLSEENQDVAKVISKQEEDPKTDAKNENVNPLNAKPQTEVQPSSQAKVATENKQDDEQSASDDKPPSEKSPTKVNTSTSENITTTPPKPPSQPPESANKQLKLPNGVDALAALSNLKLKLPAKSSVADADGGNPTDDATAANGAGNSDAHAAGSASDGPAPRPKTPNRLSIEQKRRLRRAKKEEGVKME